jgi:hypothetical protein
MKNRNLYFWVNFIVSLALVIIVAILFIEKPILWVIACSYFLSNITSFFVSQYKAKHEVQKPSLSKIGYVSLCFLVPCIVSAILAILVGRHNPYFRWTGLSLFAIGGILSLIIIFSGAKKKS